MERVDIKEAPGNATYYMGLALLDMIPEESAWCGSGINLLATFALECHKWLVKRKRAQILWNVLKQGILMMDINYTK